MRAQPLRPSRAIATSPRRWLGFELNILRRLKFSTVAIPFSGQPDLDWYLKFWGKEVHSNDLCQWAWWMARAYVENGHERLGGEQVTQLLEEVYVPPRRLHNPALSQFFNELDAVWFDNLRGAIEQLDSPYQQALAISHALMVGGYALSFPSERSTLKRPLSDVFRQYIRQQREILDNGRSNRGSNREATDFIAQIAAELMFVRFPSPEGYAAWSRSGDDWKEIWVRGTPTEWETLRASRQGRLGETVLSKGHYLELIAQFLGAARQIPTWAIAHTEDGFLSIAELATLVREFRRVEAIYHKDFSEVVGGHNAYLLIAR
jgi:hypothetical protein